MNDCFTLQKKKLKSFFCTIPAYQCSDLVYQCTVKKKIKQTSSEDEVVLMVLYKYMKKTKILGSSNS